MTLFVIQCSLVSQGYGYQFSLEREYVLSVFDLSLYGSCLYHTGSFFDGSFCVGKNHGIKLRKDCGEEIDSV